MACCAFAVMILMQLLAPALWAKRRLRPGTRHNAAAAWRLQPASAAAAAGGSSIEIVSGGATGPDPRSTRWGPARWAAAVVAAELVLLLAAGSLFLPDRLVGSKPPAEQAWTDEQIWYEAMHDAWCRALDIDRVAG